MGMFRRNIKKSYKIVEISGNPKDVLKYLGVESRELEAINAICKKFKKVFAIREMTTYNNLFGICRTVESPFIPKFYDNADTIINTLKFLGLNYSHTFYSLSAADKHVNSFYSNHIGYINTYAFSTREDAHKALEAYLHVIEKEMSDKIAEQELNNQVFKIHSEEVLI